MLARERAMREEIKIQKIKDIAFILMDKREIKRFAHTVIFQNIVRLTIKRIMLRSYQILQKN